MKNLRMVADAIAASLAWVLAYVIRFDLLDAPKGDPGWIASLKLIPFVVVCTLGSFFILQHYNRKHRSAVLEALDIVPAAIFTAVLFTSFTYFYTEYLYSRLMILVFALLLPLTLVLARSVLRKWTRFQKKHSNSLEPVLLVEPRRLGPSVEILAEVGQKAGVVMDATAEHARQDLQNYIRQHAPHTLWIALSNENFAQWSESGELARLSEQVLDIRIIPDIDRYVRFRPFVELIGDTPVISLHHSPLNGPVQHFKRLFDIVLSVFILFLISPLMLWTAFKVRQSSPGPIFYRQPRMGLDGRVFDCLKFRSMPVDAEAQTGAVWAKKGETRATAFGSFIRKYSIDELPQLFNVLKGDMSLVGPRPERPVFVQEFRDQIPGYMLRHKVRSGITGWAQVNGYRGDTSLEKRIECDLYYIQNWTLWLDIKILWMTIAEVFFSKNAY